MLPGLHEATPLCCGVLSSPTASRGRPEPAKAVPTASPDVKKSTNRSRICRRTARSTRVVPPRQRLAHGRFSTGEAIERGPPARFAPPSPKSKAGMSFGFRKLASAYGTDRDLAKGCFQSLALAGATTFVATDPWTRCRPDDLRKAFAGSLVALSIVALRPGKFQNKAGMSFRISGEMLVGPLPSLARLEAPGWTVPSGVAEIHHPGWLKITTGVLGL